MKKNLIILFVFVSLGLPRVYSGTITLRRHTPTHQEEYYFLALKGAYEQVSGDYKNARKTYGHLRTVTPTDQNLLGAALRLAFDHGHFAEVLSYAPHIDITAPQNKELAFLIAQAYLFLHKNTEGIDILEALRMQHPRDDRFDYFAAIAYTKINQAPQALAIINAVLADPTKRSRYYLFHFLKAKYLFLQNQCSEALDQINASLVNNPSFAKGFFLKGTILEQLHQHKQALAAYQRYQTLNKNDATIAEKIEVLRKRITS
jgi:predicted Zn-dependent protease